MSEKNTQQNSVVRPPVVVVVGHIDHGKSTLLDYIRKTNIVDKEAGGITQHLSAYEVTHKDETGADRKITFLDTPGHEAFSDMRNRGAKVADIAILMVSAEDSVKAQTIEALNSIKNSGVPFIVAINKIDKPGANIEKVKMDLAEHEVYVEGYGGSVPFVPISAKVGTGVDDLLGMILLVADLGELTGESAVPAEGLVIESNRDAKRGISATLLVKNGSVKKGEWILAGESLVPVRIMENILGKSIDSATFSSPIRLVGFDSVPTVGSTFQSFASKKEAEKAQLEARTHTGSGLSDEKFADTVKVIPLIIKTDVGGTGDAVVKEIKKLDDETVKFKIIDKGVGSIGESDMKKAIADPEVIIIGFTVKLDARAEDMRQKNTVNVQLFDIIYKITEYLEGIKEERRPRVESLQVEGSLKVIRVFSKTKDKQVVGGKVVTGKMIDHAQVRILRRDFEVGRGHIVGLEQSKMRTKEVAEGLECGVLVESKIEIAGGDVLEAFVMVTK